MISRAEGKRVRRGPVFIMNYCSRQLKLHGNSSTMILGWEMLITTEQSPGLAEVPGQSDGTWAADVLFYTIPAIKNTLLFSFSYICNRESENRFCFFLERISCFYTDFSSKLMVKVILFFLHWSLENLADV